MMLSRHNRTNEVPEEFGLGCDYDIYTEDSSLLPQEGGRVETMQTF